MSHIAEIASMASQVSAMKHAESMQSLDITMVKKSIDVNAKLQQQMIAMMQQSAQPHLGGNVNVSA